jgi:tetratricopeptide (TPR) repeat protein
MLEGETPQYFWVMSRIVLGRGDADRARELAERAIAIDPQYAPAYDALGFAYQTLGQDAEAVSAGEKYVRLRENSRVAHFNLVMALNELGDRARLEAAAERTIPIYERHTRLNPDDYSARVQLANIHAMAGRGIEALAAVEELSKVETLDGAILYNLACVYLNSHEPERGLEHLERAVQKGFRGIDLLRRDPDFAPLHGKPEFEALLKDLEEKIAHEKNG